MKKLIVLVLLLAVFVCARYLACTKSCKGREAEPSVLRIGTNANFPPFETIDKNGGLVGFDIDMGRAIAEVLGLKPEFKEFDFDALILALKKNQIDVIMSGLSITSSRKEEIAMEPYQGKPMTEIALLFWNEMPNDLHSLEDVKRLSSEKKMAVSVQAGHFLEGFLREQGIDVKPLVGPPEQILDIKYKKSLAAALDDSNARVLASKHPDLKLLTFTLPEEKWDLGMGIGIKKENIDLQEKIRDAVKKLEERGVIKALSKKWLEGGS